MKIIRFVAIFTLLAVAAAAQSTSGSQKIETKIRTILSDQVTAWNRGDLDGFMEGYWKSDELIFVSTEVTRGWQKTLDRYRKNYDSREKMGTLTFGDLSVSVMSKTSAIVYGSWSLARKSDNPKGRFTLIFEKMKEGWRIVYDHSS